MPPEGNDALNAKFRLGTHPSKKTGVFQQPEKRIIFADFCFQSIGMAQINVVLQEFLQRNKC
ncbi:Uncharacterised protein [Paenibacillus thiaminolyticus]|nr:Uncharacterised protein [Paenibacillus thiaminolyticus]